MNSLVMPTHACSIAHLMCQSTACGRLSHGYHTAVLRW